MFGLNKKKTEPDNNDMNIVVQNQGQPQPENMPDVILGLDEEVVKLLTDNGNIQRMANLENGRMITKLITKNICIYKNSKNANEIIATIFNVSVSKGALLLKNLVQVRQPMMNQIEKPI